jgi:hypothetical protein
MASDSAKRFRERYPGRWRAMQKRSKEKHIDRVRAQNSAWRRTLSGRVSMLLAGARRRAKDCGQEFALVASDIQVPEMCPLLGTPLFFGEGKVGPNSPTLDRVDSTKGYVPGNVWVVSHRANQIKNDATAAELFLIARKLWERINGI